MMILMSMFAVGLQGDVIWDHLFLKSFIVTFVAFAYLLQLLIYYRSTACTCLNEADRLSFVLELCLVGIQAMEGVALNRWMCTWS